MNITALHMRGVFCSFTDRIGSTWHFLLLIIPPFLSAVILMCCKVGTPLTYHILLICKAC